MRRLREWVVSLHPGQLVVLTVCSLTVGLLSLHRVENPPVLPSFWIVPPEDLSYEAFQRVVRVNAWATGVLVLLGTLALSVVVAGWWWWFGARAKPQGAQ